MTKEQHIKKEWGEYYPQVKKKLDREGWYDGRNDKVKKEFPKLDLQRSGHYQRPASLIGIEDYSKVNSVKQIGEVSTEVLVEAVLEIKEERKSPKLKDTTGKVQVVGK